MKALSILSSLPLAVSLLSAQVNTALARTPAPIEEATAVPSETDVRSTIPSGQTSELLEVVVQLADPPLAAMVSRQAGQFGAATQQRTYAAQLAARQDAFMLSANALGAKELARVSKALNAVIVSVTANRLADLAKLPGVKSVRPVRHYARDLSETVPYIGAGFVQNSLNITGTGVTIAVLDSGIDYTHVNLGGPGTSAAYQAAWGTSI